MNNQSGNVSAGVVSVKLHVKCPGCVEFDQIGRNGLKLALGKLRMPVLQDKCIRNVYCPQCAVRLLETGAFISETMLLEALTSQQS